MGLLVSLYRAVSSRYHTYQANNNGYSSFDLQMAIRNIFLNCDIPYNTFLCFESAKNVAEETSTINLVNEKTDKNYLEIDGNNVASCYTTIDDYGKVLIVVSIELLTREINEIINRDSKISSYDLFTILDGLMMHEIWHAHQFRYIYDKHGNQEVIDVCSREKEYPYGEGPLESGAVLYSKSNGSKKQNLKEVFG